MQAAFGRFGTALAAGALAVCGPSLVEARDPYGTSGSSRYGTTISVIETAKVYDPFVSVWMEREERFSRKDYFPRGARIGSFTLLPFIEAAISHDDNVFANAIDQSDTLRYDLSGGMKLHSDFARHVFDIDLFATRSHFSEFKSLDHTSGVGEMNFRLDINHGTTISGSARSELEHEEFSSAERPSDVFEAVPIWINSASLNFMRNTARLNFGGGVTLLDYNFDDVRDRDGNLVDQDERDNRTIGAYGRIGYRFSPGYEAVLKGRGFRNDNYGATDTDRSYRGWEVLTGVQFEASELFKVSLLGGFERLDFDNEDLDPFSEFTFEARGKWSITPLVTLDFRAGHEVGLTTLEGATARSDTKVEADMEYKIWRNLILDLGVSGIRSQFRSLNRTDDAVKARAGLQYLPNRNLKFTFDYEHERRRSDDSDFDFSRNVFRIGGTLGY